MQSNIKIKNKSENKNNSVRVRIIKSPLVDTTELRRILSARTNALVL